MAKSDAKGIFLTHHFINTIELAAYKGRHLKEEGKPSASTDYGSIVSFTDKVGQQQSDDVLNSTLLAQLAADHKYPNPQADRKEWFNYFAKVMRTLFWVMESDAFVEYKSKSESFTVDKVFLELLAQIATDPDVKNVIQKTLDAFKQLPGDDRAVTLFYNNSNSGKAANFQLNSATQDSHGDVAMVFGAMNFEAVKHTTRFLFFEYESASTKLFQGVQKIVLNESQYATVREQVIKKLGHHARDEIAKIQI